MISLPSVLSASPHPYCPTQILPANSHKVGGLIKHKLDQITPIFRTFYQLLFQSKESQSPFNCLSGPLCFPTCTSASILNASTAISLTPPASPLLFAAGAYTRQSPIPRIFQFCSFLLACSSLHMSLSSALCSNVIFSLANKIYTVESRLLNTYRRDFLSGYFYFIFV